MITRFQFIIIQNRRVLLRGVVFIFSRRYEMSAVNANSSICNAHNAYLKKNQYDIFHLEVFFWLFDCLSAFLAPYTLYPTIDM